MHASEILRTEHRAIEQVLDSLWALTDRAENTGHLDVTSARQAIEFLREYADECHHGKEEAHFFPAMEARGFPRDGGPTGVMIAEHEAGRQHVREMRVALDGAQSTDLTTIVHFAAHARAFVGLLRDHIQKEDHCLFGMADRTLTEAEQQALLDAFAQVEAEHSRRGTQERCLQIARELAAKYGPSQAITASCQGRACSESASGTDSVRSRG